MPNSQFNYRDGRKKMFDDFNSTMHFEVEDEDGTVRNFYFAAHQHGLGQYVEATDEELANKSAEKLFFERENSRQNAPENE